MNRISCNDFSLFSNPFTYCTTPLLRTLGLASPRTQAKKVHQRAGQSLGSLCSCLSGGVSRSKTQEATSFVARRGTRNTLTHFPPRLRLRLRLRLRRLMNYRAGQMCEGCGALEGWLWLRVWMWVWVWVALACECVPRFIFGG